jgi:parvulin-like peptidyl-prolyl isomerase
MSAGQEPRLARSQQSELPPTVLPKTIPTNRPPVPPPPGGVQPVNLRSFTSTRVAIRAHVNGKPIFDDDVMQLVGPNLRYLQGMSEAKQAEKVAELYNQALDKIIEDEIMYQDAVRKLEKINPRALDKLKSLANEEFEKILRRIRDSKMPEDQVKEMLPSLRRQNERNFVAVEYVRSRIMPILQSRIGHHRNEFQKLDTVQWQDVFIVAGGKHPTVADAHRFAEDLIAKCRDSADFAKLVAYDDGDAKLRNGEGAGQRRGEIRPPEVEDILFNMKDNQVEIVDIATGVHIIRLVKRENAGQIPLNEATQKQIRRKLENQIVQREYQRIVRELKQRTVIEVLEPGG